ncbi:hypothetical protein LX36DRAFT_454570 [Colletotrichum falcatum]|nr:hypothetical protein LX36DRAFT_454570 [Colletotrichum falcatum]
MYHVLNTESFPRKAENTEREVAWSEEKFVFLNVTSKNDNGTIRTKGFLQRRIHDEVPVDAVLVFARIKLDGAVYFILTRQWREATGQYCIDAPAGVYKPAIDQNAQVAGLRELREETPLDATVVCESVMAVTTRQATGLKTHLTARGADGTASCRPTEG